MPVFGEKYPNNGYLSWTEPRGAAHNDEGCRSARALRKPQWADAHGSLNGMLDSHPNAPLHHVSMSHCPMKVWLRSAGR